MTAPAPAPASLDYLKNLMREASAMRDFEAAHSQADELLIETVRFLAKSFGSETEKSAEELIDLYDKVGKWYA